MALRKLQPKKFTEEGRKALSKVTRTQEVVRGVPKSTDPVNFPVYENPVNAKDLVYVPNHVVLDEKGNATLRMDTPLIHAITDGKRYLYYRCISGLTVDGYSGTCPLCEGTDDCWTLANILIEEKCKARGLNPKDTDSEDVKAIRSQFYGDRILKESNRKLIFPIVVFETKNHDGKTLERDEDGNIKYKIMWYVISEQQYEKTWLKALETMEDEPTHPGGYCFVLNYTYTPKRGEPNKRDSARNLVVGNKRMKGMDNIAPKLDKQTEGWTPEKAQETVIQAIFYEEEDLEEITDELLEPVRQRIELYQAKVPMEEANTDAGFQLEKKEDPEEDAAPVSGLETDLDGEDAAEGDGEGDIDME